MSYKIKKKFGKFKKYSKKTQYYKLNNHYRNLTFDGDLYVNNQRKTLELINNENTNILYNKNLYNNNGEKIHSGQYDQENVYSQVFSGSIKTNKIIRTYLLGCEDIIKVKLYIELINSMINTQLVNDNVKIELLIDFEYKKIEINPMIIMLTESFQYKYMNERYPDFAKKTKEEKELLKEQLNNDKNYLEQQKKLLNPYINYLNTNLYTLESNLDQYIHRTYTEQQIISVNNKPSIIRFSTRAMKPISPYLVNYVLNGWSVKVRFTESKSIGCYFHIDCKVLVMDKMLSYVNRTRNLDNKFHKLKAMFEKLKEQNKRGTETFEKMLTTINTNNPDFISQGKRIESTNLDFIYRKIQMSKIWITNKFSLLKTNETFSLLNNQLIKSHFGSNNIDWRMKIKKIYLNLYYEADPLTMLNYPINMMLTLHSFNTKEKEYTVKELIYGVIYPNNIVQNHKKNVFIIQDKYFSQFYFKNATDFITITFDYSEQSEIPINCNIYIEQCYIKYKPIINLRSKLQDDMTYYPMKVLKNKK